MQTIYQVFSNHVPQAIAATRATITAPFSSPQRLLTLRLFKIVCGFGDGGVVGTTMARWSGFVYGSFAVHIRRECDQPQSLSRELLVWGVSILIASSEVMPFNGVTDADVLLGLLAWDFIPDGTSFENRRPVTTWHWTVRQDSYWHCTFLSVLRSWLEE